MKLIGSLMVPAFLTGIWLILRRRYKAGVLPLIVGGLTCLSIILPRHGVRLAVGYYELRERSVWGFYILRGIISGGFEEGARYLVFKKIIPGRDRTGDWLAYGMAHGAAEILLTEKFAGIGPGAALYVCMELAVGMAFSMALSGMVFTAAHQERRALLAAAFLIHWGADLLPAFYLSGMLSVGGLMWADALVTAGACAAAWFTCREE